MYVRWAVLTTKVLATVWMCLSARGELLGQTHEHLSRSGWGVQVGFFSFLTDAGEECGRQSGHARDGCKRESVAAIADSQLRLQPRIVRSEEIPKLIDDTRKRAARFCRR